MKYKTLIYVLGIIVCMSMITFAQADLAVKNLVIDPEKPKPGETVTATTTITNPTDFDFKGKFNIKFYLNDEVIFEEDENGLSAGGVKTYQTEFKPDKGENSIKVILDSGEEIEMNALNNVEEHTFLVLSEEEREKIPDEKEYIKLPDLACLEMLHPDKADLRPERIVVIYAIFQNYGNVVVRDQFEAAWVLNDEVLGKSKVKNFPPNLQWKFGLKWKTKKGRHNLKAVIDQTDVIKEKEEENNACEFTFTVYPEDKNPLLQRPRSGFSNFSYREGLADLEGKPVYVENVLIEPVVIEGEINQYMHKITYVVHNRSNKTYKDISITVYSPDSFIHTFYIEKLSPDERYQIYFFDRVNKGKLEFKIDLEESYFEYDGLLIESDDYK